MESPKVKLNTQQITRSELSCEVGGMVGYLLVAVLVLDVEPVVGVHGVRDHESRHPLVTVRAPLRQHARHLQHGHTARQHSSPGTNACILLKTHFLRFVTDNIMSRRRVEF